MKLEIGYKHNYEIRKECCAIGAVKGISIAYLSDLHFNKYSELICDQLIRDLELLQPEIILLGGDYIDSKAGLFYFKKLLAGISGSAKVFAIAGNHDFFFGIDKIKQAIEEQDIRWIEQKSVYISIQGIKIRIDGNKIFEPEESVDLSILCLHKPIAPKTLNNQYDLCFAGHLHGCQFVLWQTEQGLYPGKLFYPNNFLSVRNEQSLYLISKGLGDTFPLRYNCPKDILFLSCIPISSPK